MSALASKTEYFYQGLADIIEHVSIQHECTFLNISSV